MPRRYSPRFVPYLFDTKVRETRTPWKALPTRVSSKGVSHADACFHIRYAWCQHAAYYSRTIKAIRALPRIPYFSSPRFRMSAAGTFPFYWTAETSIARDDSTLEYIGIRIGWRAGTQDTAPESRRIVCMPVLTENHDGCCVHFCMSMCRCYVHRVYWKFERPFKKQ